jgi:hypothetical protein
MGGTAHLGMQAKALLADTAHGDQWRLSCRDGLHAQHFASSARQAGNIPVPGSPAGPGQNAMR